jgi:hypothetical protein
MKRVLKAASVLSWVNLIIWAGISLLLVLSSLVFGIVALAGAFLLSAIPLHCYAGLQLHKSIRYPAKKLSNQTPVGIRFVGSVALFFGILMITDGIGNLAHPGAMIEAAQQSFPQMKEMRGSMSMFTVGFVRISAAVGLILGLAVALNVTLNFRLLRWYYLVHQSDASKRDDT